MLVLVEGDGGGGSEGGGGGEGSDGEEQWEGPAISHKCLCVGSANIRSRGGKKEMMINDRDI